VELDTRYPLGEEVALTVAQPPARPTAIALRLPGWCAAPELRLNGVPMPIERRDGYARIERDWRAGDRITLTLPMRLRVEPTPDDPRMVAYMNGPLVLAADLCPAEQPFDGLAPAIVSAAPE